MTYIECARKLLVRVSNHGSAASGSYAMWVFDWLFGRRKRPRDPSTGRRYEYLTGNVEEAIRVNRGEPFQEVGEDIQSRWTPGNEYLWDEYDAESLIDSDEKRQVPSTACYMRGSGCIGRFSPEGETSRDWTRSAMRCKFPRRPRPSQRCSRIPSTGAGCSRRWTSDRGNRQ